MLSCEGVLATLFYRMNTNQVLQKNYGNKEFYEKFLLAPIPDELEPRDLFTPFENVMLKHFWIWSRLGKNAKPDKALFLEYIQEWSASFPKDGAELIRIFTLSTIGKTVSNEMGTLYEKMSYFGMVGNIQEFRRLLEELRAAYGTTIQAVMSGKQNLDANVGPQIWVNNQDFSIRHTLWDPSRKRPLWINLNTASEFDLMSFPGISQADAQKITAKRNELGFFKSLDEAKTHGFSY